MKKNPGPSRRQLRSFWDRRQTRAGDAPYSGYLSDESPKIVGQTRFEGERRELDAWLNQYSRNFDRCLDLGCGTGDWSVYLAKRFQRVDALDWAPSMVRSARRRAKETGISNVFFSRGEITALKGKARYDLIFVGGVLMYATDAMLDAIFRRAAALLKPGGMLVLRESTRQGQTLYRRDFKLRPGLLAKRSPKADYAAIYRDRRVYEKKIEAENLKLLLRRRNRHYHFTNTAEAWLLWLNRLSGGALAGNPGRAASWASWIYRVSWITLWPSYLTGAWLRPGAWPLHNYWLVSIKPFTGRP